MTTTTLSASAGRVRPSSSVRINPDTVPVLAGLLVVLVAVAAASFTLSFTGLSAAAPWASIPADLAWLVPVALEVAMLAYVVVAFVRTHRGERARLPWTLVWALTTVSSALNALHAWDAGPQGWQGAVGAGLAGMFPFMTLAAAHVVAHVAFAPRPDTAGSADTAQTSASGEHADGRTDDKQDAGQDAVRAGHPAPADSVRVAAETTDSPTPDTTDVRTDAGARPSGQAPARGRVAEHRADIVRLARTTTRSGRAIAAELGLDKTAVCAIVRAVRTQTSPGRAGDWVNSTGSPVIGATASVGSLG